MTCPETDRSAGGMANQGGAFDDVIRGLGFTKQAASQLIDLLVDLRRSTREEHPEDRHRMLVQLTERGRAAAVPRPLASGGLTTNWRTCSPRKKSPPCAWVWLRCVRSANA